MRRVWDRTWWLASLVLASAALAVYWSHATPHLCYRDYWLSGDSGIAVYNAWQVTIGRLLYGDIFEYRMPLWFFLWSLLFHVTGPSPLAAQIATVASMVVCAPFIALVLHRVGASRAFAIIAGALPIVLFFPVWPYPIPPWLGWIPLAIGLWSLGRALREDAVDRGWLMRAGVLTGLYALCIQSHGAPFAVGATLALFIVLPVRRWRAIGWFIGGGLLSAAPILVYLIAHGLVGKAYWNTVVWTTQYYHNDLPHQLFAGVRSYYEKRGLCQVGGAANSRLYDISLFAIPIVPTLGAIAGGLATVRALVLRLRGRTLAAADQVFVVVGLGGLAAFLPQILIPAFSDNAHLGQAGLAPAVALAMAGVRAPRAVRVGLRAALWLLAGVLALVYFDRVNRYQPFQFSRFTNMDSFVKWYVSSGWMVDLTEPGDTIVVMPYGGWQYLSSRRESGIGETFLWSDEKFFPPEVWDRAARELRERNPALLLFNEDQVRQRLWQADPTVPARYFWNGRAWERRDEPHDDVAGEWSFGECGGEGGTLTVTQDGPALSATHVRATGEKATLLGSERGHRFFLWGGGGGEMYLMTRDADGLGGTFRRAGKTVTCRLSKS